jgi:hypothetical protein
LRNKTPIPSAGKHATWALHELLELISNPLEFEFIIKNQHKPLHPHQNLHIQTANQLD